MTAFITAGAGFLLAVLWFDLMFDVQVLRAEQRADAVASIATYYRRVTIEAYPMNRLVSIVMLGTLAALIAQVADDGEPRWASITSLLLVLGPAALAMGHTFRNGTRLGARRGTPDEQVRLAQLMLRDHLICLAAIVAVLVVQLACVR